MVVVRNTAHEVLCLLSVAEQHVCNLFTCLCVCLLQEVTVNVCRGAGSSVAKAFRDGDNSRALLLLSIQERSQHMKHIDIKMKLAKTGIKQWQVAERMRIGERTLCRMMRRELSPERKAV